MKKFKNKFAVKFNDPILGEAMKKKLIEIGHEWHMNAAPISISNYILVGCFGGNTHSGFNQCNTWNITEYTLPQDWQKVIELASEEEKKWKVTCFKEDEKEALKLVKKIINKMNTWDQIKLFEK